MIFNRTRTICDFTIYTRATMLQQTARALIYDDGYSDVQTCIYNKRENILQLLSHGDKCARRCLGMFVMRFKIGF